MWGRRSRLRGFRARGRANHQSSIIPYQFDILHQFEGWAIEVMLTIPLWLMRLGVPVVLLWRRVRYGYAFRRIRLTQGKYAIVDPHDYPRLRRYRWHAVRGGRTFYAERSVTDADGSHRKVKMHRDVLPVAPGLVVDHISHNGLDNRKANLRPASRRQNRHNCIKCAGRGLASQYKGVWRSRGGGPWKARIRVSGRPVSLGSFREEAEAALAYDRAAERYHGEFAALNFPQAARWRRRRREVAALVLRWIAMLRLWTLRLPRWGGDGLGGPWDARGRRTIRPRLHVGWRTRSCGVLSQGNRMFPHRVLRFVENGRVAPTTHALSEVEWVVVGVLLTGRTVEDSRSNRFDPAALTAYLGVRGHVHSPWVVFRVSLTGGAFGHRLRRMPKTLYIIDGHGQFYASYYAKTGRAFTSPSGEPTNATYIFTNGLMGLIQRQKPDMLCVAMDSAAPTFRAEAFPQYKAHRPPMPEDLAAQIDRIREILEAMNIPVLCLDGFEADDIIGTLAKKAAGDGFDVLICSKDKDILQLLDDRIRVCDMKTGEIIDPETMKQRKGIEPRQIVDCLALQGDASDNVPGVPLIGEKTACELIGRYGDLDNLYAHADEIAGKRGENLRNSKEQAYLSRGLVTLDCEVPIEIDYEALALTDPDAERLTAIYTELGFARLLTQLGGKSEGGERKEAAGPVDPVPTSRATLTATPTATPERDLSVRGSAATVPHQYTLVDTPEKLRAFAADLRKHSLFAVDTETTSINAMRAELVGLSFCWEPGRAFYLPVKGPLGSTPLGIEPVRRELGPILADTSVRKIGQNLKYDLLVLRNAKMPVGGVHFDTMVASYVLDPERTSHSMDSLALDFLNYECIPIVSLLGKGKNQLTFDLVDLDAACEYSAEDADVTYQLYQCLRDRLEREPGLGKLFHEVEMPLVGVLVEMEHSGVSIDTALLRQMSGELEGALSFVAERIYEQAGTVFNVDSPKQLAVVLFDRLRLQPGRLGKAARSTDAEVLEQLAEQHPIAAMVLEYRSLTKLKNTYCDKLGTLIHPKTGRVHTSFNQTVTATGRLSSSNPNLQNIPIRTELGRKIRAAFIPQHEGDCILSADYSQIELRLLAHFSGDETMRAAFAADQDIHRFVASQIFGVSLDAVTNEQRSRCKTVNFGIIYGQGALGLARTIGMSTAEARQFIEQYFTRYGSIRAFIDECVAKAERNGYAETILGRRRQISDLRSKNAGRRAQAERFAVNTVIQGSAADLIKVAMVAVQSRIETGSLPVRMILQVHDELVFEVPASEAQAHGKWITAEMTGALRFDVPLKVDTKCGPSWLTDK